MQLIWYIVEISVYTIDGNPLVYDLWGPNDQCQHLNNGLNVHTLED